ncbi:MULTISPECIES: thermonuclease family protein [unclassified Paenarthrobacter]|uniref:thermonuclease family protein n=1 Tax=unclassified Paenarthrobacter TaxID=2634190 RepID=UPI00084E8674|nr:thermonuclease family protein [Paenarthrobacter sp. R1]NKR13409.1 nuclease [Arthrobacter sp. M5]NKR16532.1 nuclease [Arthrobacter sp. M6]OEH58671.1 nuclease [Arthrobacter sp. D2]OEH61489.1 nuclease [Arthrobacter sp. D4]WIV29307.1 thermonuclease family protein [Paenarthrobacter sp. R1]
MTGTQYTGRLLLGSVLAVLALTGCTAQGGPQVVPAGGPAPLHEVPCDATGTAARPPALQATASGPYLVESVVDGDTIRISCNGISTRVRLVGLNAPESVKGDAPVECGGPEASTYLHSLLDGQQVFLAADPAQGVRDKYDRLLAYVWSTDGTLANRTILEQGHAEATGYGKSFAYSGDFTRTAEQAKESKAGRWAC